MEGDVVLQVLPPSLEYCTTAPLSTPESVSAGLLVILSVPLAPVSLVSATPGAAGAPVSSVKVNELAADALPATSICRTCTVLLPCVRAARVGADALHVPPPLSEYCTTAPLSIPESVSAGLLVIF